MMLPNASQCMGAMSARMLVYWEQDVLPLFQLGHCSFHNAHLRRIDLIVGRVDCQ